MANPAFVQSTTAAATGNVTTLATSAFGVATTTGNAVLAMVIVKTLTPDVTTVTDSAGNIYNPIPLTPFTAAPGIEVWIALNITGGASTIITATDKTTSAHLSTIVAFELSGLALSSVVDVVGIYKTTSQPSATITVPLYAATNNPNDILVAVFAQNGGTPTYTAGSGYSNITTITGTTFALPTVAETQVVSSVNVYTASVGGGATSQGTGGVVVALSNAPVKVPNLSVNNFQFPRVLDNGNGVMSVTEKIR